MMMWQMVKSVIRNEKGQGMVEYGLIIALVAVAVIAGLQALTGGLNNLFNGIPASL